MGKWSLEELEQSIGTLTGKSPSEVIKRPTAGEQEQECRITRENEKAAKGDFKGNNGTNYSECYRDIFLFHRRHYPPSDTEEYWEAVVADTNRLIKKHHDSDFMKDLLKAVINAYTRECENMEKKEKQGSQ